jgi:anaerobic selenocysteine-containing dehydrogenase/Fe-S-cluster-containing dehydrogenase component
MSDNGERSTVNGQRSTDNGMNRRRFLKVLGVAGGGTASLAGCGTDRVEKLIPYLVPPENQTPGIATWYATTCRECPTGCGLHVRVREGRAVKLEGNPVHPINQGKLCARGQAGLQGLYNPDRVQQPMVRSGDGFQPITWDEAIQQVVQRVRGADAGAVWFLSGNEAGPFGALMDQFANAVRGARAVYEAFGYEALRHANRQIFGTDAIPEYRFEDAAYVLSFGADFLETWVAPIQHARGFARSHGLNDGGMGRFVHIEPRMSMTAMNADEWIAPAPGTEAKLALAIAHVIVRDRLAQVPADVSRVRPLVDAHSPSTVSAETGVPADTIERLAREFTAQPSLGVAGGIGAQHDQAHVTAAAVNVLNYVAGNVGRTVVFGPDLAAGGASTYAGLADLVGAMRDGRVGVLFVHGTNPAYNAPDGLDVAGAMEQVGFTVSFARFMDETTTHADLILPDHDPLEQWNAYQPRANVYALQQPVMQPVFDTRQTGDVLLEVARGVGGTLGSRLSAGTYKDFLMNEWRGVQRAVGDRRPFEEFWEECLQRGGVWRDPPTRRVSLAATAAALREAPAWSGGDGDLTLVAYPSPALYDGRAANRPWLQELPDPVTKITWSTWVELHPETASEWGIAEGDHVRISSAHGEITVPAYPHPGIRRDTVAVPIGQGHTAFGRYANGRGASVYRLLGSDATEFGGIGHYVKVRLAKTGAHERLPKTEGNRRQMGRGIAQATTLAALHEAAEGRAEEAHHAVEHAAPIPEHIEHVIDEWQEAQYRETRRGDYANAQIRWAMAIDLSRCTGCSACVTACYAENNIPTVGPELVRRGREMSWMRIERYFEGDDDHPEARVLPMLCQQCGSAPCEPVCPVFAAYHTPDGLNAQVYNRCVGTRYCSNNCPYKVRYFNWFDHQNPRDPTYAFPEPLTWQLNPDVTVRSKGVMEKCTFCVQRIRGKQNQAALEGRALADGEVLTACQQTCPSDAIVFGDLNDPASRVAQLARDGRGYHVLEGLNTRPAITYLKKVRNLAEA